MYQGSNGNFADTTTPFSMLGNAMSYFLIINGTSSSPFNYTAYPQLSGTCFRQNSNYNCAGWNTWELFITNIEAFSHSEIFLATEAGYGAHGPIITFLGQSISIPTIGTNEVWLG